MFGGGGGGGNNPFGNPAQQPFGQQPPQSPFGQQQSTFGGGAFGAAAPAPAFGGGSFGGASSSWSLPRGRLRVEPGPLPLGGDASSAAFSAASAAAASASASLVAAQRSARPASSKSVADAAQIEGPFATRANAIRSFDRAQTFVGSHKIISHPAHRETRRVPISCLSG